MCILTSWPMNCQDKRCKWVGTILGEPVGEHELQSRYRGVWGVLLLIRHGLESNDNLINTNFDEINFFN